MTRVLLHNGFVVNGHSPAPVAADVLVVDGEIAEVGKVEATGATVIDCDGRYVMPGFVDAHSHAEAAVFEEEVQLALLRQGVTTIVGGQDGVSFAPGPGAYGTEYFAAINGTHPRYRGGGVASLLASYDDAVAVNAAYLVPAGTVRREVLGTADRPADPVEIARMAQMVARGLADGAVGLSTGLDYSPGIFAGAEEIAALCVPLAEHGLPYVTHMRGGYEANARVGVEEGARIAELAGVRLHLSHFHTAAETAWELLDWLAQSNVEASFDMYPYTRGCTLLAMVLLPPALTAQDPVEVSALLRQPEYREELRRTWLPRVAENPSLGAEWPEMITIGHAASSRFDWVHGLTLAEVAARSNSDVFDVALDVLAESNLEVNAVMAVHDQRPISDLGRLFSHPKHMGGSDGIFVGKHPHPRARGTFAHYLRTYVRDHEFLTWNDAVGHLSTSAVDLFRLGARGRIQPGSVADIIIVDGSTVTDQATYEDPMRVATGIDDVLVAGRRVLADGHLTGETPGRGVSPSPRG